MFAKLAASTHNPVPLLRHADYWGGIGLVTVIAVCSLAFAHSRWASQLGLSALTIAVVIGMIAGNTFFPKIANKAAAGVDFSKNSLLRLGVVLYGFRITFQQIAGIGMTGFATDMATLSLTFGVALFIGLKLLKMDRETVLLIGTGSSICGAAAIMAAEPVVRAQAHKVSVAVATVVVFGTLSMFLYPLLYPVLGLSDHAYGIFVGSTVHEVAQVVAAGSAVSDTAANTAIIEKMLRVMMLAPFLVGLSLFLAKNKHTDGNGKNTNTAARITIPWFAVLFVVASGIHSLNIVPEAAVTTLNTLDTLLLTMAMAALGLRTHIGAIRQAGIRPLLLGAILFVFLVVGGYGINLAVAAIG
ncbi:YeiH family protein [Marinobacter sp. 1Y8]